MTDETSDVRELLRRVRQDRPDAESVDRLRALLDADDATVRRRALDGLDVVAARDRSLLPDDFERVRELLDDPSPEVRTGAASVLASVAAFDPDAVLPAASELATLLDAEYEPIRDNAAEAMASLSQSRPDDVRRFADDVAPLLDADRSEPREHAAGFLAAVAVDNGDALVDAAPLLLERLVDEGGAVADDLRPSRTVGEARTARDRIEDVDQKRRRRARTVRQEAGAALREVAKDDPDAVAPSADELAGLLDDSDPQVRAVAADLLVILGDRRPDAVEPHAEAIADRLATDGSASVRARVAQALATLSVDRPDAVAEVAVDRSRRIRSLLDHDVAPVRGAAATLLALVADRDPDAVEPAAPRLRDLADDGDEEYVRAAAADALRSLD